MIQLKSILNEQYGVKKFIIQTPAPKAILDIVRKTKPRGAGFIVKSTAELGSEPSLSTIIDLIKLDPQFGKNSIWATAEFTEEYADSYVYILGPDQKDAQRKTKFNVMIVPKSYIIDTVLGPEETDATKKQIVYDELVTIYSIGNASVMTQTELDELKNKMAPQLDKERIKKLEAENAELKKALSTNIEPAPDKQTVVTTEPEKDGTIDSEKTDVVFKTQELLTKLKDAPITLNTTSDDVKYIQDLLYRIGMKMTDSLGEKNDYPEWVAFRDAKSQYGTYGTRTKNFINLIKTGKNMPTNNNDITAEVFQMILDAGKPLGINESNYQIIKSLIEQFVLPEKPKVVNNKPINNVVSDWNPIGTDWSKLNYKTPIKQGAKGQEVKAMQIFINGILAAMGKASEKIKDDGVFGPATLKAHNIISKTPLTLKDWSSKFTEYKDKKPEQDVSSYKEESELMEDIWQDAYDVFVKFPEKYFKNFSKWYNDKEEEAADWVLSAWDKAWGEKLKKLKKSESTYIQNNVKNIEYTVNYIANKLIRAGYSGRVKTTFWYLDKNNKWKSQPLTFEWNYM